MKPPMIDGISQASFRRFCKQRHIAFAALFGSAASGRTTTHSDLDIAFWLEGEPGEGREVDLTADLMRDLHRNNVDVVVLNHANPLLQWQVASTGKPLYERRPGTFRRFQIDAMKRYDDSRKLFALQELFLQRFVRGARLA